MASYNTPKRDDGEREDDSNYPDNRTNGIHKLSRHIEVHGRRDERSPAQAVGREKILVNLF